MPKDSDYDDGGGVSGAGGLKPLVESKLSTLLFGPSAKQVGDYLGERTGSFLDRLRAAQISTVKEHVNRVVEVVGEQGEVEASQVVRIERWAKTAETVPVNDAPRAAIVEASLAEIMTAGGSSDYEQAAEKLTTGGARVLLDAPSFDRVTPRESDQAAFDQLLALGLAGKHSRRETMKMLIASLVGIVIGLIVLLGIMPGWHPQFLAPIFSSFLPTEFVIEGVGIGILIAVIAIPFLSDTYRLTDVGRALQASATRFYEQKGKAPSRSASSKRWLLWSAIVALSVFSMPLVLRAYLPTQLRFGAPQRLVTLSAPPSTTSDSAPAPPSGASAPSQPPKEITLPASDVRSLISVWKSVAAQMADIVDTVGKLNALHSDWRGLVGQAGISGAADEFIKQRDKMNQERSSMQPLLTANIRYPNVEPALQELSSGKLFNRVNDAINSFANQLRLLPAPLPNYAEERLQPYSDELTGALAAMDKWARVTREYADTQSKELAKVDTK